MVYNGKEARELVSKDEAASPAAYVESIMITRVIDAKEDRDVMTGDVPNAFIQANMPKVKQGEDRVMMKIIGVLLDMLVQLAPEVYGPCVVYANGKRTIYVEVLRAIYGLLQAALLRYNKSVKTWRVKVLNLIPMTHV